MNVAVAECRVAVCSHQGVFAREARALWQLAHPAVVRLVAVVMERDNYSLVLEYMHLGSLGSFRADLPHLGSAVAVSIVRDIVSGMHFLHSHTPPILHLDIKADNILINRQIRAKVRDQCMISLQIINSFHVMYTAIEVFYLTDITVTCHLYSERKTTAAATTQATLSD